MEESVDKENDSIKDQTGDVTAMDNQTDHKRKRRRKSEKKRQVSTGSDEGQGREDFPIKHKINVEELKKRIAEDSSSVSENGHPHEDTLSSTRHRRATRKTSKAYDTLSECRKMFRQEMALLGKEVGQFRAICQNEISKYKRLVLEQKARLGTVTQDEEDGNTEHASLSRTVSGESEQAWEEMLTVLQLDMDFLARKQSTLDKEQQLLEKEESLSQRQKELEEYEKEINEIERMLDRRQNMCNKRQQELSNLDEELQELKSDLNETKEQLETRGVNTEMASERAKHNWDIVRKNLFEKQTFLENTVQKYRMDLATAQSNITSKDILLVKQQDEIAALKEEMMKKNAKISQLETQLTFTLDEARALEKKFHQILLESESSIINSYHYGAQSSSPNPQKRLLRQESSRSLLREESSRSLLRQESSRSLLNRESSPSNNTDRRHKIENSNGVSSKHKIVRHQLDTNSNKDSEVDVRSAILSDKSASCVVM